MLSDEKYIAAVVSTVRHLIGLQTGEGENEDKNISGTQHAMFGNRREFLNVENINFQSAQKWEAGALLQSVADLNMIPEMNVNKIKENSSTICSAAIQSNPASTRASTSSNVPMKRKERDESADTGHDQTNLTNFARQSGFIPPRRIVSKSDDCSNNDRMATSPSGTSLAQRKQFSFRKEGVGRDEDNSFKTVSSTTTSSLFSSVGTTSRKPGCPPPVINNPVDSRIGITPDVNPPSGTGSSVFKTAHEQLIVSDKLKGIQRNIPPSTISTNTVHVSGLRKIVRADVEKTNKPPPTDDENKAVSDNPEVNELMAHESMKNVDPKMVEAILNEVVQIASTDWNDIAGLEGVKSIIKEIIIWPILRPDIFTGLRASPRGILFFGPPGTGKTMFGRVIATQSQSTFFNISASSLTSKWIGDGEKMVRALFQVARLKQPAVIFIDEIDSILTQRSETEHESSRRLKTEFLIQFDGCATQTEDRILVIGVTNRPQELDEAARRRLVKRIYIPLPDFEGRKQLVKNLLRLYDADLTDEDYNSIAEMTEGYSGADMTSLCREAAYGPIREVGHLLHSLEADNVRAMQMKDFVAAQRQIKSSVAKSDVELYEEWDAKFGCHI